MAWLEYLDERWWGFLLVLARSGGLAATAPFLGARLVPWQVRALFALALTVLFAPLVNGPDPALSFPDQGPGTGAAGGPGGAEGAVGTISALPALMESAREVLKGALIGFGAALVISTAQMAGSLLDVEMGFGMVNVVDPTLETQAPLVGNFQHLLALIIFLLVDGHHLLLRALWESFRLFPPGTAILPEQSAAGVLLLTAAMFSLALQLAAPVLATMFLTTVALGLLARTVPQMNVFFVGLPLKAGLGILLLVFTLPIYWKAMSDLSRDLLRHLGVLMGRG
ncbi:MAG: flagellar biosynthetic protein FliR [Firmicutes bacterium]|nr:flagellar biosynthetic protein FliR [Bacillota bacterium]